MKKAGIFEIKGPSNFREKIEEKLEILDICTNPFEEKLPLVDILYQLIDRLYQIPMWLSLSAKLMHITYTTHINIKCMTTGFQRVPITQCFLES